uniref:protein FAM228A isoform X2 n=1 Tax=Scatophagus argus TaxID=75038 RepID=UPI001ED7CF51|nr:protein FAM228A isoform X2 [Scatophagus argus]
MNFRRQRPQVKKEMSPKKKNTAIGVITFHTSLPVCLLKSQGCMADVKDATESRENLSQRSARTRSECVRVEEKDKASPVARRDWLSHTSIRQLRAKMEADNEQVKELIQPLLDTENGFMKELERFLSQRDVAELRRRELLHKRWTERVWFPLQRRVEEHVSSCSPMEAKRRQTLYSRNLHHCNTKLTTADLKDPLYLQLPERLKEKRTARSNEAGCIHKLPQSPLMFRRASSNYEVSAFGKTSVRDETEVRKSSRLNTTTPYHISATATPDGRCHQASCWFSRCGGPQQPSNLHQSAPTSQKTPYLS